MPPHGRHTNVRSHRRGGPRRRLTIAPWIVISTVSVLILSGMTGGYVYLVNSGCSGDPVTARILAEPSVSKILDTLARQWQESEPQVNGRCADIQVIAKDSADVATALQSNWDPRLTGPAPDVWVPQSSGWVRDASSSPVVERMIPDLQPSLARTPTVIAMPQPMAELLQQTTWAKGTPTWTDIVAALGSGIGWDKYGKDWGPFKVAMSDPAKSTAGLHALMAVTDANDDGEVTEEEKAAVWTFKQAVNRSGLYKDSTDQIIAELHKRDAEGEESVLKYLTGFPALERDVLQYNASKPKVPLAAVYAADGSADADEPYLVLNSPWKDPARMKVAEDFLKFIRSDTGRDAFQAAGFRDPNRIGGSDLKPANGIMTQVQSLPRSVMLPESVAKTRQTWTALARPINVLLVLDTSGSMGKVVLGTNDSQTRLQQVQAAAANTLALFGSNAHIGLWSFSNNRPGGKDWEAKSPIDKLDDAHKADMLAQIKGLTAVGGTGLFTTTWGAYQEVQGHYLDGAANLVVLLTDGEEEDYVGTAGQADKLKADIKDANTKGKKVQIITIAYGPNADSATLQDISRSSGAKSLQAKSPHDIDAVMLNALLS